MSLRANPLMEAIHDMVIQDRQIMQRIKSLGYPDVDNISPKRLCDVAITELYKEATKFRNRDIYERMFINPSALALDNPTEFRNMERKIVQIMALFLQRNIHFYCLIGTPDTELSKFSFPKSFYIFGVKDLMKSYYASTYFLC